MCEEDYHGNQAQFLSSFISPVCNLFQTLKKVKKKRKEKTVIYLSVLIKPKTHKVKFNDTGIKTIDTFDIKDKNSSNYKISII